MPTTLRPTQGICPVLWDASLAVGGSIGTNTVHSTAALIRQACRVFKLKTSFDTSSQLILVNAGAVLVRFNNT